MCSRETKPWNLPKPARKAETMRAAVLKAAHQITGRGSHLQDTSLVTRSEDLNGEEDCVEPA